MILAALNSGWCSSEATCILSICSMFSLGDCSSKRGISINSDI